VRNKKATPIGASGDISERTVNRLLTVVTLALLLCAGAGAQSDTELTGTWKGQTPNGTNLTLELVQKGDAFTGTLTRESESTPISEGKVSKNTFTFKATFSGETETVDGTFDKTDMKAWLTRQGPERAAMLKRLEK
jgi:hypothetical protein